MSSVLRALTITVAFGLAMLMFEAWAQQTKGSKIRCREACGAEAFQCLKQANRTYQEASKGRPDPVAREIRSAKSLECVNRQKDCNDKCLAQH